MGFVFVSALCFSPLTVHVASFYISGLALFDSKNAVFHLLRKVGWELAGANFQPTRIFFTEWAVGFGKFAESWLGPTSSELVYFAQNGQRALESSRKVGWGQLLANFVPSPFLLILSFSSLGLIAASSYKIIRGNIYDKIAKS